MKGALHKINIQSYISLAGFNFRNLKLSYQTFGPDLGNAPVVLVNHALTGNSQVCGESGWWNQIIGSNKVIDTNQFTILAFNIPGNGYDDFFIQDYEQFIAKDIAKIFLLALQELQIDKLFAIIGGSLGGGLAWEMCVLQPTITENLVPIASDWKATDWLIANCRIQEQILNNSSNPVHDARMHAMLCYRTPQSFNERFQRTYNDELDVFNIESWLLHHGKKLQHRFQLYAYRLMNHLLKTINTDWNLLHHIKAKIHIIAVNSDLFFTPDENLKTFHHLKSKNKNVFFHEINSLHGHDAFLMEYPQLAAILQTIFIHDANTINVQHEKV